MLLVAILAAGCGGGGSAGSSTCTLGSAAGCGGTLPPPTGGTPPPGGPTPPPDGSGTPGADPAAKVAAVSVVSSASTLPSSGQAGTEVTVTALLKSADNVGVAGATVKFAADSGLLSVGNPVSDANGKVVATLSTGGSPVNRAIKISATAGSQAGSATVNVSGTHFTFDAPATLAVGASATVTATLLDSANQPIVGAAVTGNAQLGNSIVPGAVQTDSKGQVAITMTGKVSGTEAFMLSALGATATRTVTVSGGEVALTPGVTNDISGAQQMQEVEMDTCTPIAGTSTTAASTISYATSRGTLYSDAGCSQPLSGALSYSGGTLPGVWLKSSDAGVATVDGVLATGGRGSTMIQFIAPLRPSARVDLQADQAVVTSGARSTLIAVVRDGTAANNVVKNALVDFSIVQDPSGGALLAPLSATTGSDGVARAVFLAGPKAGDTNATVIEAKIDKMPTATSRTALTVNGKALSVEFGTGNSLTAVDDTIRQKNFAVFVSDNAGNPVKDVTISASAWAVSYSKGKFRYQPPASDTDASMWIQGVAATCANEDVQRRGIFDHALDINGNGVLDPGVPLSVTVSGKTDATGVATVSLRYPADRAYWNTVQLTVSGTVQGTETTPASVTYTLEGVDKEYTGTTVAPPGVTSPYGQAASCNVSG
jgi:hypothetical protein